MSTALVADQREANEKLVLAGLRAQEQTEAASRAHAAAETRADDLQVATDELLATAEFRERLIGIVGHDLRNPLNAVVMGCGLLMARGSLSEEDARIVHRIANSGHRMARMIGQLAEFTRARLGGGFDLDVRPCDLRDVCANIVDELRVATSAEIRYTADGDLAGAWDAGRLSEVVSNLVGNAIDHAAPGTAVTIRSFVDGDVTVTEVRNHGVCIPPEMQQVIFSPFRRGTARAIRPGDHLGLGLYIAHEVVRAHGGTLDVRSSDGTTTFTMTLPRVVPPPAFSPGDRRRLDDVEPARRAST